MQRFNPADIEPKWQKVWDENKTYSVTEDTTKQKMYVSGMFPYPSGSGLHSGHAFSYTIVDAIARFHRTLGYNVLNPMGWDTFGLPAENYAIKTGTAPSEVTKINIANFKTQFKRLGISIDWQREINTTDPEYYRWTQWVFIKLFERGLAYQKESQQWWCPVDKTVLANEQVENGHCWRCGSLVEKKSMKQWFFKITDYADALLEEIPGLDWPEKIKTAQTNWIGKSQGAEISFQIDGSDASLEVFTTRPDTIFGATFMVIAPEHPLANMLITDDHREEVEAYVKEAMRKSEIERQSEGKEKSGVFTGSFAINPANGEKIPVWIADYVLGGYGTGAIMAVPAHDDRDYEFATKFSLPIRQVVAPVYVQESENPPRDGVEMKRRKAIQLIVKHPENDSYLLLKKLKWETESYSFVNGGVEDDEDVVSAAARELAEEAGFDDYEPINEVSGSYFAVFYHEFKQTNVTAHMHTFATQLKSLRKKDVSEEESQINELLWVSADEVLKKVNGDGAKLAFSDYLSGKSTIHREGQLINSGNFDGMTSFEAREEVVAWLEQQKLGKNKVTYKMRDWLISRQRYWGAPIPIIHCETDGAVPVPEDQLPVILPPVKDYAPKGDGQSALANVAEWVNTTCPKCGGPAKRETDTMDGYACSSWYLLRYADPHNNERAWDPAKANYWSPVDYYVGGDHAVAHLLYVRFWTHVFKEMGLVDVKEPVKKLVYHGYINAEDGRKMSKSLGNVIDPLEIIDQGYGADTLRTYVLFMGPIELDSSWSSKGVAGVYRFLNRAWTLTQEFLSTDTAEKAETDTELRRQTHKVIKKVTEDYHDLSFNTSIAAMMEYVNELYKLKTTGFSDEWRTSLSALAQLLGPIAPHMANELWQQLGHDSQLDSAKWPHYDESLLVTDVATIVVQVNGKVRAKLQLPTDVSEEEAIKAALADEHVQKFTENKQPAKVVYIPGRLISIVP
jgi:leucyl-tRNA synthetase